MHPCIEQSLKSPVGSTAVNQSTQRVRIHHGILRGKRRCEEVTRGREGKRSAHCEIRSTEAVKWVKERISGSWVRKTERMKLGAWGETSGSTRVMCEQLSTGGICIISGQTQCYRVQLNNIEGLMWYKRKERIELKNGNYKKRKEVWTSVCVSVCVTCYGNSDHHTHLPY